MTENRLVFLITGTSKGIGRFLAEYYCNQGHIVIGCSRTSGTLEHMNYTHFQVDVSDETEVMGIFRFIRQEHKALSVLINNAAINPAILMGALLPYDTILKAFKVNVIGSMLFCREGIKLMMKSKFGRIINLGSMASKHEVPGESLYTATKSAMNAYTRVLSKEVYKMGITANVIAPSAIDTDLSSQINKEALNEVLSRNAIGHFGEFQDVTNVIDLLIKPESKAITGQIIYLGGV